jgi:hypothetical protein
MSFKYMAKRWSDGTDPWRTSYSILKKLDITIFHFTQVEQLRNHCSKTDNNSIGMFLYISLINKAQ